MEDIVSTFGNYKGKADRHVRVLKSYYLEPRNMVEQVISEIYKQHKEVIQYDNIENAIQYYLTLRNARHDIWCTVLEVMLGRRIGDVRFRDFRENYNDNTDGPKIATDRKVDVLTPDILYIDPYTKHFILGDITVTNNIVAAESSKKKKYNCIYEILSKVRPVIWSNFVVHVDLSNINELIGNISRTRVVVNNNIVLSRAKQFHQLANTIMEELPNKCENKNEFYLQLSKIDNYQSETYGDIPQLDYIPIDFELINSEEYWIDQIGRAADDEYYKDYFDKSIDDTNNAFDELINGQRDKEHAAPKSTLKVCSNQHSYEALNSYDLIRDYIIDLHLVPDEKNEYLLNILPTSRQLEMMRAYKKENKQIAKGSKVYGKYYYNMPKMNDNCLINSLHHHLSKGKKLRNEKENPKSISPDDYDECMRIMESGISYYGKKSNKPPFLNDDWDAKNNNEMEGSSTQKSVYDFCRSTNGAQLGNSLSNLYQRIMHTKTQDGKHDMIYTPPNGSFVCVIPKNHAPINQKRCDLPFIFITRVRREELVDMDHLEPEYIVEGFSHNYYVSKLFRLDINKISCWDQAGYRLVACSSFIISKNKLYDDMERVVGILTYLLINSHQKTSEYLDLFKYIAYMPFSEISRLSCLIKDKLNIMTKTSLDIWLILSIQKFLNELSRREKIKPVKQKITIFNSNIITDCLGMKMRLPSFFNTNFRYDSAESFIEEITMLFTIRPKHLYGSQFIDKAMSSIAEWNLQFEKEKRVHGKWLTEGFDNNGVFPLKSDFAFNREVMYYAQRYHESQEGVIRSTVTDKLAKAKFNVFMHENCSLRGCTKEPEDRSNPTDYHTTSLEACLNYYQKHDYNDHDARVLSIAHEFLKSNKIMEFSMSEKDQRGSGRPIATPTLMTKAALMAIEKPEQAIGSRTSNNIIVEKKNKLQEQCEAYKSVIKDGSIRGFKEVYQLTEDQSKFSEMDNFRKFKYYISSNSLLDIDVKAMQLECLNKLEGRVHLCKRIPKTVLENPELVKYVNVEKTGIKANIGWPQGMLNFISTSVHCSADTWITYAFNKYYSHNKVMTKGCVHSDDSWVTVACDNVETFEKFAIFRMIAKRHFCLKLNEKKLWGSKYLGELVSNYNINGNVHLSISKIIANSFCNLMYQSWVIDVHNQISSLQQAYRNGCQLDGLILLKTILRQQLFDTYQVKGMQKSLIYTLPIELGGFPDLSAFELSVSGLNSHYYYLQDLYTRLPDEESAIITRKAMYLSIKKNKTPDNNELNKVSNYIKSITDPQGNGLVFDDEDYEGVVVGNRGDIFTSVRYLLPKTKKTSITLQRLRGLPFEGSGLEMIMTSPHDLKTSLGDLKARSSNMLYALAADQYTQNTRRLAISQAIQSSNKVVKILGSNPMTINEMLNNLLLVNTKSADIVNLQVAFDDDTKIPIICSLISNTSTLCGRVKDNRKVINKLPYIESRYNTSCNIKHVLLRLVDKNQGTNYLNQYTNKPDPLSMLDQDGKLIMKRFNTYFMIYNIKYACNLIMQQYLASTKSKQWMQPRLRDDSLEMFLCDLYGKTLSPETDFKVEIDYTTVYKKTDDDKKIDTIYTTLVLNQLYPGLYEITHLDGISINRVIDNIDHTSLDDRYKLKYGVIQKVINGVDDYIIKYDESKLYDQYYTKSQYYANGTWQGDFICLVRSGSVVVRIEGEPKNIRLIANNPDINTILYIMWVFVKENFPLYSYSNPKLWHQSEFWNFEGFHFGEYLNNYGPNITIIDHSKTIGSLPISINKNLRMNKTFRITRGDSYEVSENLRVVNKIFRNRDVIATALEENKMLTEREYVLQKMEEYNRDTSYVDTSIPGPSNMNVVTEGLKYVKDNVKRYVCKNIEIRDKIEMEENFKDQYKIYKIKYERELKMLQIKRNDPTISFYHDNVIFRDEEKVVRVGSISQSLSCPLSNKVTLKHELHCGISNEALIKDKLIINVTLQKMHSNTTNEVLSVLRGCVYNPGTGPIIDAMLAIMSSMKHEGIQRRVVGDHQFDDDYNTNVIETFDIEDGIGITTFAELENLTEPQSLDFVLAEYQVLDDIVEKNLTKYVDIKKVLYRMLCKSHTDRSIKEFIYSLLNSEDFNHYIGTMTNPDFDWETLDDYDLDNVRDDDSLSPPIEIIAFIIGNDLHIPKTYKYIFIRELLEMEDFKVTMPIVTTTVNYINEIIIRGAIFGLGPRSTAKSVKDLF